MLKSAKLQKHAHLSRKVDSEPKRRIKIRLSGSLSSPTFKLQLSRLTDLYAGDADFASTTRARMLKSAELQKHAHWARNKQNQTNLIMDSETLTNVFWSKESAVGLSHVPGVDFNEQKFMKGNQRPKSKKPFSSEISKNNPKQANSAKSHSNISLFSQKSVIHRPENTSTAINLKQASLKDLCLEDKERIANLIRELAKAGEEKEATEHKLNDERQQFALKIDELKSDKEKIEQEQKSLLLEFKECQRLLGFYQQKITEEQKEVARDINRLLGDDSSYHQQPTLNSSQKASPRPTRGIESEEYDDDITVKEVEGTISSHRSAADSYCSDSRYADVTGSLGESFRPASKVLRTAAKKGYSEKKGRQVGFTSPETASEGEMSRDMNRMVTTTTDDDVGVSDFPGAFERRIRALSPNGRRQALLKQKRDLELEQAHLHTLLAEQEELLRYRQEELEKRHVDYTRRMQHFKQHGTFPSVHSSMADSLRHQTTENDSASRYYPDSDRLREATLDTTFTDDSSRRHRSQYKSRSEPAMRRRKFMTSITESDSADDKTPVATDTYHTNRSLSQSSGRRRDRSTNNGVITDITNFSSSKSALKSPKNMSRVRSPRVSYDKKRTPKSSSEYHSTSLQSQSDTSLRSPQRTTMNNISTLSDLVCSVEASRTPLISEQSTPLLTSHISSTHSDDTMVSLTFDPEDSQLLEDIFFIN